MSIARDPRSWGRYVAIGDSFTEGMSDPDPASPDGDVYAGWADRLAAMLAVVAAKDDRELRYANLAIRGRLLDDIVTRQVDDALGPMGTIGLVPAGGSVPGVVRDHLGDVRATRRGERVTPGRGVVPVDRLVQTGQRAEPVEGDVVPAQVPERAVVRDAQEGRHRDGLP